MDTRVLWIASAAIAGRGRGETLQYRLASGRINTLTCSWSSYRSRAVQLIPYPGRVHSSARAAPAKGRANDYHACVLCMTAVRARPVPCASVRSDRPDSADRSLHGVPWRSNGPHAHGPARGVHGHDQSRNRCVSRIRIPGGCDLSFRLVERSISARRRQDLPAGFQSSTGMAMDVRAQAKQFCWPRSAVPTCGVRTQSRAQSPR